MGDSSEGEGGIGMKGISSLLVAHEAVVLEVLLHLICHEQPGRPGADMNDAEMSRLRMPLLFDFVAFNLAVDAFGA